MRKGHNFSKREHVMEIEGAKILTKVPRKRPGSSIVLNKSYLRK